MLPNAVCTVHRLHVHLRIPVAVENDNSISYLKIQADAACASRQQKDPVAGVLVHKPVDDLATLLFAPGLFLSLGS